MPKCASLLPPFQLSFVFMRKSAGIKWSRDLYLPMPTPMRLNAAAFISPQNHPILVRNFTTKQDDLKYHYVAHTSLDVIEERRAPFFFWLFRVLPVSFLPFWVPVFLHSLSLLHTHGRAVAASSKHNECYLGLLYSMEELAVYGFVTPAKLRIVIALALSDAVVRDADVVLVCHLFFQPPSFLFFYNRFLKHCIRHIAARLPTHFWDSMLR